MKIITFQVLLFVALVGGAVPAFADRHGGGGGGRHHNFGSYDYHDRGYNDRGHGGRDYNHWGSGRWYHGDHGGRWAWWWIVGDAWYRYPVAVYPYPDPYVPPVAIQQQMPPVVQAQPQVQMWYYCNRARAYYPYVSECPSGWTAVPATPPTGGVGAPPPR